MTNQEIQERVIAAIEKHHYAISLSDLVSKMEFDQEPSPEFIEDISRNVWILVVENKLEMADDVGLQMNGA